MARRSLGLIPLAVAVIASGLWLSAAAAPRPLRDGPAPHGPVNEPEATTAAPARAGAAPLGGRVDFQAEPDDTAESGPAPSRRRSGNGNADADEAERAPVETASDPYRIVRSGRPRTSADSALAYDGDRRTSWTAGDAAAPAYVWFDLGDERPVALVRWLRFEADGAVAVQVSDDGERWTTVAREDAAPAGEWRELTVGERARYVRLVFGGNNEQALSSDLAEVEIFGPPGVEPTARSARAASAEPDGDRGARVRTGARAGGAAREPEPELEAEPEPESEPAVAEDRRTQRGDGVRIETSPGTTDCDEEGRATCVVRGGRVDVHEDCGGDGSTCRIDVSVDGGTAACDAAGGSGNEAGRGRGAREGDGGVCRAEASGGTVEIGDVNP